MSKSAPETRGKCSSIQNAARFVGHGCPTNPFVGHKTGNMRYKWICSAQVQHKYVCCAQNDKCAMQMDLLCTSATQIRLLRTKREILSTNPFVDSRCATNLFVASETGNMSNKGR